MLSIKSMFSWRVHDKSPQQHLMPLREPHWSTSLGCRMQAHDAMSTIGAKPLANSRWAYLKCIGNVGYTPSTLKELCCPNASALKDV
jgi:hypothetical protein